MNVDGRASFDKQDCWKANLTVPAGSDKLSTLGDFWMSKLGHTSPDTLDTLMAIITKSMEKQCRSEVEGLLEGLFAECRKIADSSEEECLHDLFGWLVGDKRLWGLAARLAHAPQEAMLWAGFYDGDPRGLNQPNGFGGFC